MTDESSKADEIRFAPNGKFYVRQQGETFCLPDGSLRYFATEQAPRAFLADGDVVAIDKVAA